MPRKSARRPRQLSCRAFHPDPDELIRALRVAFGVAPLPVPPQPPVPPLPPAARAVEREAAA
jgi:hypothetical protein